MPDSSIAKDSGVFDITYKTMLGCDIIVYYNVTVDKDISYLTMGEDTCLIQPASRILQATPGYAKYYWLNDVVAGKANYKINSPGNYWVNVSNTCGTKTDSITIFDRCDYPIDMPTAFTPNGDGLNDLYKVPMLNKNKLIRLRIYN